MEGTPKRVIMDALLIQMSSFSFFEERSVCPAAMSLTVVPLKDDITKEQFFGLCAGFKWAELQKEILFMAVIFGYFEQDGQTYGLLSAVYPTVELANLVNSRGWFTKLISGEVSAGGLVFTDMVKGAPKRAVGEAIVLKP